MDIPWKPQKILLSYNLICNQLIHELISNPAIWETIVVARDALCPSFAATYPVAIGHTPSPLCARLLPVLAYPILRWWDQSPPKAQCWLYTRALYNVQAMTYCWPDSVAAAHAIQCASNNNACPCSTQTLGPRTQLPCAPYQPHNFLTNSMC